MTSIYREPAVVVRDPDKPYSVPDAATAIGVSQATLYRMLASGAVASIVIGKRRAIAAAEVRRVRERGVQQ